MGSPKTQLQSRIPLNSVPAKRLPDQGLALPQTCCKVNPTWPGLYIRQMQMCLNKAHCAFLGLQQGRGCNLQLGNCQERNTFQLLTSTGVTSLHCFVSLTGKKSLAQCVNRYLIFAHFRAACLTAKFQKTALPQDVTWDGIDALNLSPRPVTGCPHAAASSTTPPSLTAQEQQPGSTTCMQ